MIRVEELRHVPDRPILTEAQARSAFKKNITEIADFVRFPIRVGLHNGTSNNLLIMTDRSGLIPGGEIDRDQGQKILFEVMTDFGLDQSKFYKKRRNEDKPFDLSIEHLVFPSQTISGLVFERERGYSRETGETSWVRWQTRDEGPRFRFGRLVSPKPLLNIENP